MVDWAQLHDAHMEVDVVPELLEHLECEDDAETWKELGYRLVLEGTLIFPASVAALPRLVHLASNSARARELVGAILRCSAAHHGCDDLLAESLDTIATFRALTDHYLQSRPTDYLSAFLDLLAARGEYHWSNVIGDFTDDFYHLACPHCTVDVTIAIGNYGRYSAIRDWHLGDVDRRDLRPRAADELTGVGRWMHETAARDAQESLADGIAHLFGRAVCPRCASVFNIADEEASANRPVLQQLL